MRNNAKRYIAFFSVVLLLCSWMPTFVFAKATSADKVKVGYYEDGDYMAQNSQEEYVGFNFEFLQEISKQSGLQFEVVDAGSWSNAYEMLVSGEIDILPGVYFSEERAAEIAFATQPMCSVFTTLNIRMNDRRYDYEDFDSFQGMKVGIIKDGIDGENFRRFCDEKGIALQISSYAETDQILRALDEGRLDGVAITHLGKNTVYRSVAQFAPSPLYLTVTKGKPALLAEINRAMNTIFLNNPGYSNDLYDKYLAPSAKQSPSFTKAEREFIAQGQEIVVSYDPAFAPFSYTSKNGEREKNGFKGVSADVFDFIERVSGLQFRFEAHSQGEGLALLAEGKVDVLSVTDGDYLWDKRNDINATLYYLQTPTSVITLGGSSKRQSLALMEGYQLSELVAKEFLGSEIEYFTTPQLCLAAVAKGLADATYMNAQVAGFYLGETSYTNLIETPLSQYSNAICIGVSEDADTALFSILNKCIRYLPTEQLDGYIIKNSVEAKEVTFAKFVEQHTWAVIGALSVVLGIIIALTRRNLKMALGNNRRIQDLLYQDALTGIYSLNGFYQGCEALLQGQQRPRYALLYGDISQFKIMNDSFGFATGDQILIAVSKTLSEMLQENECCGRISADTFSLLMVYEQWETLCQRLQESMETLDRWREEEAELPYRINLVFGVYLVGPEDEIDLHQMMDLANYARKHAKSTPGVMVAQYDEGMRQKVVDERALEDALEQALQENEFEVYYQPKVSMADGKVIGCEALIRWNHPEKGFLTPGRFIPIFEKNATVGKVDFWLFEDVCRTMQGWQNQGKRMLPISCNFSRLHFQEPDFPARICEIADRYGIAHRYLEIEITESALIAESDRIVSMLPKLQAMGFPISIDDFGSGYSSLGQLQKLHADVLKLDRSFVSSCGVAGQEQVVLKHVIHMGEELGLTVICEGIETKEQGELLQSIGCQFAQGFYYYRPMEKQAYERLI